MIGAQAVSLVGWAGGSDMIHFQGQRPPALTEPRASSTDDDDGDDELKD